MATLKTNYKDDLFSGSRKYEMIRNQDGTVSFEDVTDYLQEGDPFGSTDINVTNAEVNALNQNLTEINSWTLTSTSWTSNPDSSTNTTYPYIYEITSDKYTNDSTPIWDCIGTSDTGVPTDAESEAIALVQLAYFSTSGVILYATDAPTTNIKFRAKGV